MAGPAAGTARRRPGSSHDPRHDRPAVPLPRPRGPPPPALLRGRRALLAAVALLVAATAVGLVALWPPAAPESPIEEPDRLKGTITDLQRVPCFEGGEEGLSTADELADSGFAPDDDCSAVTFRVDEGPDAGTVITSVTGNDAFEREGQGVVLFRATEGDLTPEQAYQIGDVQRGPPLLALGALFLIAVLALGRLRGALAVVGLAISVLILVKFLVPALLAGQPPVLTAVVGASAVMIVVLVLAHGPTLRTATAMVGTAGALLLTIGLAAAFAHFASLSGVTSDDAIYVEAIFGTVDLRGLLLAGIVIGALGILDDVTVTQVSTVYELRAANPAMPPRALYTSALRVGRDHIASTINTLLLAYAGASMPLLVILATSGAGLTDTLTNGVVAEEVVRTLVGSIGLIAAVPVTTALAAAMAPAVTRTPTTFVAAAPPEVDPPPPGFFGDHWANRSRRGEHESDG